jgi:hypothetical protein
MHLSESQGVAFVLFLTGANPRHPTSAVSEELLLSMNRAVITCLHMSFFFLDVVCRCLSMWRSFSQRADIVVRGMTTVEQFLRLNMNELRNVHGLLNHLLA